MKFLFKIIFVFIFISNSWADEINSSGLICELNEKESKRAPSKKLIYYFDNGTVYAVQVFRQSTPIKIGKILISQYQYDDKEIKWEGENSSKSIKYYAVVDRFSHVLNLKYVFVSGSKSKNNAEKSFYCKITNWKNIEDFLNLQIE